MKINKHKLVKDAELVEKRARVVIIVDEDGHPLQTVTRLEDKPKMNVLAVIGPLFYEGEYCGLGLWLEIGLGQTKPYHRIKVTRDGSSRYIRPRDSQFVISREQMTYVWPFIENVLSGLATQQINQQAMKESWRVWTKKCRFNRSGYSESSTEHEVPPHVRFSFSLHDKELVRILYSADLQRRSTQIVGAIRFICKSLNKYQMNYYTAAQLRSFARYPGSGVSAVIGFFNHTNYGVWESRMPVHHVCRILKSMALSKSRESLLREIIEVFSLTDLETVDACAELIDAPDMFKLATHVRVFPRRVREKAKHSQDYVVFSFTPHLEEVSNDQGNLP